MFYLLKNKTIFCSILIFLTNCHFWKYNFLLSGNIDIMENCYQSFRSKQKSWNICQWFIVARVGIEIQYKGEVFSFSLSEQRLGVTDHLLIGTHVLLTPTCSLGFFSAHCWLLFSCRKLTLSCQTARIFCQWTSNGFLVAAFQGSWQIKRIYQSFVLPWNDCKNQIFSKTTDRVRYRNFSIDFLPWLQNRNPRFSYYPASLEGLLVSGAQSLSLRQIMKRKLVLEKCKKEIMNIEKCEHFEQNLFFKKYHILITAILTSNIWL